MWNTVKHSGVLKKHNMGQETNTREVQKEEKRKELRAQCVNEDQYQDLCVQ